MTMMADEVFQDFQIGPLFVRAHRPQGEGPFPVLVMIHGYTGDEDVMWIFAAGQEEKAILLAPRGLYPTERGGYGWHPDHKGWSTLDDFKEAVDLLLELLNSQDLPDADLNRVHWMGFSQGAALVYALALLHPEHVASLAGLAGFFPAGAESLVARRPLERKPAFIGHGVQDTTVSVEKARQAASLIAQAGAEVQICEGEVGHKLSADCFRRLGSFLNESI